MSRKYWYTIRVWWIAHSNTIYAGWEWEILRDNWQAIESSYCKRYTTSSGARRAARRYAKKHNIKL